MTTDLKFINNLTQGQHKNLNVPEETIANIEVLEKFISNLSDLYDFRCKNGSRDDIISFLETLKQHVIDTFIFCGFATDDEIAEYFLA